MRNLLLTKKYVSASPQNTDFYVLPRPVPTQRIQIPFSQIMGSAVSRKRVYDDPFEFSGLRDYTRGDPMKYINWKATAKTGDLLVNLHESTLSQKVAVLLDLEGLGVQQADVLNEEAARIACALCVRLLEAGVQLAVYSNGVDALTGKPMALPEVSGAEMRSFSWSHLARVESKLANPIFFFMADSTSLRAAHDTASCTSPLPE